MKDEFFGSTLFSVKIDKNKIKSYYLIYVIYFYISYIYCNFLCVIIFVFVLGWNCSFIVR